MAILLAQILFKASIALHSLFVCVYSDCALGSERCQNTLNTESSALVRPGDFVVAEAWHQPPAPPSVNTLSSGGILAVVYIVSTVSCKLPS